MLIETKHTAQSVGDFVTGLMTTFFLPIIFLIVDYVFRSQASETAFDELITQSGPDCCILSFGATGAVFMDPTVRSIEGFDSPVVLLLILALILMFRFFCLGASRKKNAKTSLALGLASVFTLMAIPATAFVIKRLT